MNTLVLVLILLVVAAVVAFVVIRQRRRAALRQAFGPEYERTVEASGRREGERELGQRAERRRKLDIRPLEPAARDRFAADWRATQERFVDAPTQAVREAQTLVERVMQERGYPGGDVDQMTRDVSVDHANVVEQYRAAHEISVLNDRREATTEQLRQAMVHYRSLFADLLDAGEHDRPHPEGERDRPVRPEGEQARPVRPEGERDRPVRPEGEQARPVRPEGERDRPIRPEGEHQQDDSRRSAGPADR